MVEENPVMIRTEAFKAGVERVGGQVRVVESLEEAGHILRQLHTAAGGGQAVRWNTPLLEELYPRATPIFRELPAERCRELCLTAALGVTEADFALADSGTLVLESGPMKSRMVSLLPTMHVALLPESRILDNLEQFISRFVSNGGVERLKKLSALTFITGPSRTADIELTLTIGVHGPQSLQVLLLKDH
jgi:L-lactate dehydrogenase complex protein LldG